MATQGLLAKSLFLYTNCRTLLASRFTQVLQVSGLRRNVGDKLKELNIPEKPKRPLTPYFKFVQDHRESISRQHPEWKITEVSKQCALDWKAVSAQVKEKYDNLYKTELEQYTAKYSQYVQKLNVEQKTALKEYSRDLKNDRKKRRHRKRLRECNKPKQPIGAYMLFIMDEAKLQTKAYKELLSELKGKWIEMSESEKSKYVATAQKAQEQYRTELAKWEDQMIKEGNLDVVRKSTLVAKHLHIPAKDPPLHKSAQQKPLTKKTVKKTKSE